MTVDRSLSPDDAVVAIRSFPRRFRAVLATPDDADDDRPVDPDELARRPGPDGTSALDHLRAADGVLALLGDAVQHGRAHDQPVLDAALADLTATGLAGHATGGADQPVGQLLDRLTETAAFAADRVDGVPTDAWGHPVRIDGVDGTRQLLDVAQEAVAAVATHLRATEAAVRT